MKILITGNKGFIGSRLQEMLYTEGFDVCGFDAENDIRCLDDSLFEGVDLVIHCAAIISRIRGEELPEEMLSVNVLGTLKIVKACKKHNCKLVNFSTSEVSFPLTNIYGISKNAAEQIVKHYADVAGLQAVSVRPFMVYGKGQYYSKYKSALDIFCWSFINGHAYRVHKDTFRSWLHISDFLRALLLIVRKHDFSKYRVVEIGTEDYRSMQDIAESIGGKWKLIDAPKILTKGKKGDFSYIKKLGFKPNMPLSAGIRELLGWYDVKSNRTQKRARGQERQRKKLVKST